MKGAAGSTDQVTKNSGRMRGAIGMAAGESGWVQGSNDMLAEDGGWGWQMGKGRGAGGRATGAGRGMSSGGNCGATENGSGHLAMSDQGDGWGIGAILTSTSRAMSEVHGR
jgi:hypothetical protein